MMYSSTSAGPWIWLHIHWIFCGLAFFGFVAALLWLYKHANKKDFLNVVWISLVVGILGVLLTASSALTGWSQMMDGHHGYGRDADDWDDHREEMWDEMSDRMEEMMDLDLENNE